MLKLGVSLVLAIGSAFSMSEAKAALATSITVASYWIYLGPTVDVVTGDIVHEWRWSGTTIIRRTNDLIEPPAPSSTEEEQA